MSERVEFTGTANELFCIFSDSKIINDGSGITANNLTRKIKEHQLILEKSHNIKASFNRTNTARLIILSKVTGDGIFTGDIPSPKNCDMIRDTGGVS